MIAAEIRLYRVDGKCIWPIMSAGGELLPIKICYLICEPLLSHTKVYGIEYSIYLDEHQILEEFLKGIKAFEKQLKDGTARTVNLSGGDLGRGDNVIQLSRAT